MRHNRDEKRFDMSPGHLLSVMSNMTCDLVNTGRLRTTTPRAKMLRRYAERMITLGKNGSLAARRRAMSFMRDKTAVTKLFADVAPLFKERNGGYTRILKLGVRPGDNAHMSIIELVESAAKAVEAKVMPKKTPAKPKTAAKKAALKDKEPKTAKKPAAPRKESAVKNAAVKKAAPTRTVKKASKTD